MGGHKFQKWTALKSKSTRSWLVEWTALTKFGRSFRMEKWVWTAFWVYMDGNVDQSRIYEIGPSILQPGKSILSQNTLHKVECIFPMVILSDFRTGQYRDDDHWEDAPHFMKSALAQNGLSGLQNGWSYFINPILSQITLYINSKSSPRPSFSLSWTKTGWFRTVSGQNKWKSRTISDRSVHGSPDLGLE